jgi:hypothetical protein
MQFDKLDTLELLYAPVILKSFTASLSFIMSIPLLISGHYKIFVLAMYFNVYLKCKELGENNLRILLKERAVLQKYR